MFRVIRIASRKYHPNIVEHFENPRNVGKMDKKRKDVGTAIVGSPACGDVLQLQIEVKDGVIISSKFKTFGCGSAIASASLTTEFIKGLKLDDALCLKNQDIASHLKLPPVKLHCSMLAEDAIQEAIKDYKSKNLN
jgi:nitrogen fixation NifU-like protein